LESQLYLAAMLEYSGLQGALAKEEAFVEGCIAPSSAILLS